jgi:hypothetical protein
LASIFKAFIAQSTHISVGGFANGAGVAIWTEVISLREKAFEVRATSAARYFIGNLRWGAGQLVATFDRARETKHRSASVAGGAGALRLAAARLHRKSLAALHRQLSN